MEIGFVRNAKLKLDKVIFFFCSGGSGDGDYGWQIMIMENG